MRESLQVFHLDVIELDLLDLVYRYNLYLVIMLTIFRGICLSTVVFGTAFSQMLPDSQAIVMNELEHLYFDDTGPQGFKSGLVPCTNYIDSTTGLPNNALGRQTSAQWIRTAFRKVNFVHLSLPISRP